LCFFFAFVKAGDFSKDACSGTESQNSTSVCLFRYRQRGLGSNND
jgi:hypothetical protein